MKKKIVIIVLSLIVLIGIIFVYAQKLEEEYIIPEDSEIAYYEIDEKNRRTKVSSVPNSGYDYVLENENELCENADATWDYDKWSLRLKNISGKVKCELNFKKSLYGSIKLWDSVEIRATQTSYTIDAEYAGRGHHAPNQTLNPNKYYRWKVFDKKADGTVELISRDAVLDIENQPFNIGYYEGYSNSIELLNSVAAQFYNDKYTVETHEAPYYRNFGYNGQTSSLDSDEAYSFINNNYPSYVTPDLATNDTVGQEYHAGYGGDTLYIKDINTLMKANSSYTSSKLYTTLNNQSYFIASRYKYSSYGIRKGNYNETYKETYLWYTDCKTAESAGFLPIITLKPGISDYNYYYGIYVLQ